MSGAREQLFKLIKEVNFVPIPVTVKGGDGKPVAGLLPKDFSVYEDGVRQNVNYFTSDPVPALRGGRPRPEHAPDHLA